MRRYMPTVTDKRHTTNQKVRGSSPFGCTIWSPIHFLWVMEVNDPPVDTVSHVMEDDGDKMVTTQEPGIFDARKAAGNPKTRKGKPAALVKFGSAVVPVYRTTSGNRVRFMISYHRDGKRLRQIFPSLDTAKKEALLVAQRIQAGKRHYRRYGNPEATAAKYGIGIRDLKTRARREGWDA